MKKNFYFWMKALIAAVAVVLLIKVFAFASCTIPSSGMENSLYRGDRIIVNKWSYGFRTPLSSLFSYHRWGNSPVNRNDIVIFNNPHPVSPQTAIDNREVFVSRCVGVPGDTLMLDSRLFVTSQEIISPDTKLLYAYPREKEDTLIHTLNKLGINNNELVGYNDAGFIRSLSHYEVYLLNQELGNTLELQPLQGTDNSNIHPFVIPGKGQSVRVYPWNVRLLRNTIVQHEGKNAEIKNDTLLIEGNKVFSYTFSKDYYWMASNNSINLSDSRLFGLVPKDHIIGKASFVWFSKDNEAGLFDGYRWNRFFQAVK